MAKYTLVVLFAVALSLLFITRHARADGIFTVTTTLDNNSADNDLSLREALLVANGAATVGFTPQEQALLGGCTFSAGNITGGCGASITGTINFSYMSGVITLTSALPNVSDSRPTYVNGTNNNTMEIAIDGANLPPGSTSLPSLSMISSRNRIEFLAFRKGSAHGMSVTGDDNDIFFNRFYGDKGAGIQINGGDRNDLFGNDLGFRWLDNPFACSAGTRNGSNNIMVTGSAISNTLENSTSVCSPTDGILVAGTNALSNVVESNDAGFWYISGGLRNMGNDGSGIAVMNGSQYNKLDYNTAGFNGQHGIRLSGSGTTSNTLTNNNIGAYILANIPNGGAGVAIDGGAQWNQVLTNRIERNSLAGVLIRGSGTALNLITRTLLFSNTYDGIGERNQAGANTWTKISTYNNGGLGVDKYVVLDASNTISAPVFSITSVNHSTKVVSGASTGTALFLVTSVELYRIALDPSGYGEGMTFVGKTLTDSNGNWSITDAGMSSGCYTAIVTTAFLVPLGSSEFSHSNCTALAPAVMKP